MALNTPLNNPLEGFELNEENLAALKDSTKKLLYVLDELQKKTTTKIVKFQDVDPNDNIKIAFANIPADAAKNLLNSLDGKEGSKLNQLENRTKQLEYIYIENDHDECTVYKKLTRQCSCLTTENYNDFVIHFNENNQHVTTTYGEVIKNIRILKKFLYIGGDYTKKALIFLNDGLKNSSHTERIEIVNACSYADVCNVFEEDSIVTFCITFVFKSKEIGDRETQRHAAAFLRQLAELEEGRRYLNLSTKIMGEIKKTIKYKADILDNEVLGFLIQTLGILQDNKRANLTYYCKPSEEGKTKQIKKVSDFVKFKATYQSPYKYDRKTSDDASTSVPQSSVPSTPVQLEVKKYHNLSKRKTSMSKVESLETAQKYYADMFKPISYDNIIKEPSETATLDSTQCVTVKKKSISDLSVIDSSDYYALTNATVDVWELPPLNNILEIAQTEQVVITDIPESDLESDADTLRESSINTIHTRAYSDNAEIPILTDSETNLTFDSCFDDKPCTNESNETKHEDTNEVITDTVFKQYTDNINIANAQDETIDKINEVPTLQSKSYTITIHNDINKYQPEGISILNSEGISILNNEGISIMNNKTHPIRLPFSHEIESKLRACLLIPEQNVSEASLYSYHRRDLKRSKLKLIFTD